jgi:hypothetical protein
MKTKYKTSKRVKIVQSLIVGFLGSLAGHTPVENKMQHFEKAQKRTKFDFGVLGSLDGHTPEQEKIQSVKKPQNRTKFDFGVSWFARRPHPGARKNTKRQKASKSYKI